MMKRLWAIPAGLFVFGLALALSGCPVVAEDRITDGQGPGNLFGSPTMYAVLTVTGIPSDRNGDVIVMQLEDRRWVLPDPGMTAAEANAARQTWTGSGTVTNGRLTVIIPVPLVSGVNVNGVEIFTGTTARGNLIGWTGLSSIGPGINPYLSWSMFD